MHIFQWTHRILYLIILQFGKYGEISRLIEIPLKGDLFCHASVYCFTDRHVYTTETLQWRMQFVLYCCFFEFRYMFWLVYKCAQLQAKRAKWTENMGHDFTQRPHSLCAVSNGGGGY